MHALYLHLLSAQVEQGSMSQKSVRKLHLVGLACRSSSIETFIDLWGSQEFNIQPLEMSLEGPKCDLVVQVAQEVESRIICM